MHPAIKRPPLAAAICLPPSAQHVGGRPTTALDQPLMKRPSRRVPPRRGLRLAAQLAAELVGGRPTAVLDYPLMKRRSCRVPPRQAAPFLVRTRNGGKKPQGAWRPARAAPGARYARRPISGLRAAFGGWPPKRGLRTAVAGAPPRDPGLSPLRGPGPAGRILYKDGLRPNPLRPPRRLWLAFGQSRRRPVHG